MLKSIAIYSLLLFSFAVNGYYAFTDFYQGRVMPGEVYEACDLEGGCILMSDKYLQLLMRSCTKQTFQ